MEENFLNLDKRKKNVLTVVEAVKGRSRKFFFLSFLTVGVFGNNGELLLIQKLGKLGVGESDKRERPQFS